jgi:hypothetical protein
MAMLVPASALRPACEALPGVALGSQTLLVAERTVAFFAIWLLVLVVSAEAFGGRLPIEVSGRGVRYADADKAEGGAASTQLALRSLDDVTHHLQRRVAMLEAANRDKHEC